MLILVSYNILNIKIPHRGNLYRMKYK